MIMPNGNGTNEDPKCIYCGKKDNVFRTGKYGTFYCKNCDTTFEPIELPKCPKCNSNDEVIIGRSTMNACKYLSNYYCHRCRDSFSGLSLFYTELAEMGDEYDDYDDEGGSNYSDVFENFEDFSGDDNPND